MNIQLSTNCAELNRSYLSPQRQTTRGDAANLAVAQDSVSISQAARNLLSSELHVTDSASSPLSNAAHDDAGQARRLAFEYSHDQMAPWLDFSEHMKGTGPIRYASTGEPVTEESEAYFNAISAVERQHRGDLYSAEKVKGTPDAEILDKILGFIDSLPTRYREMINWRTDTAG